MVMVVFFLAVSLSSSSSAFGALILMISGSPFSWLYRSLIVVSGIVPLSVLI